MNRYRFKTREEFEQIGHWDEEHHCPEHWEELSQAMNHYMGKEILNSDCIALCESNDDFNMDGWYFTNHDYVIMQEASSIAKNLLIHCINEQETVKVFDYLESKGCVVDRKSFGWTSTDWSYVGFYNTSEKWTIATNNSSFGEGTKNIISSKEFLNISEAKSSLVGRWVKFLEQISSDQPIGSYDLVVEDEPVKSCILLEKYRSCDRRRITDGDIELMPEGWSPGLKEYEPRAESSSHSFPVNWCLKIDGDNRNILDKWRRKQPGFKDRNCVFMGWLLYDAYDGTYTNYSTKCPSGYVEITLQEFYDNVYPIEISEVITKGSSAITHVSTHTRDLTKKPLIEDVQSISVNLRTKKTNKLIF